MGITEDFIAKCEKIDIKPGDILTYKVIGTGKLSLQLLDTIGRILKVHEAVKGWAPQVFLLNESESITIMDEQEMNKAGWFRKQKIIPVTKCPACETEHRQEEYDAHLESDGHRARLVVMAEELKNAP